VWVGAYEARHHDDWRRLNEAWIHRWFTIEPKDRAVLDDPEGQVLGKGGRIFMVEHAGRAVGCAALLPMADGGVELAKMTVAEEVRGAGLGRRHMQACLEAARADGARRVYIETSGRLGPALALYEAFGFQRLPPQPTDYGRADVWLELPLA
jgi:GNAT superfamily N-acetyltransferase